MTGTRHPHTAGGTAAQALQAATFAGIAIALGTAGLFYFAGSLPVTLASGATAVAGAVLYASGRRRGAAGVVVVGLLTTLLVWRNQDVAPKRPDKVQVSAVLGGRRLESGRDPMLCGPVGVTADRLNFTLKPPGHAEPCRDLRHGVDVGVRHDPAPPALVGPVQGQGTAPGEQIRFEGRPATTVERDVLGAFPGRATPLDGAWYDCGAAACALVFRDGDLLITARWLAGSAGLDVAAIRDLVRGRLAAWSPR